MKTKVLLLSSFSLILIFSCRKPIVEPVMNASKMTQIASTTEAIYATDDGPTILGQQWGNPYLTTTMESARKILEAQGILPDKPFSVRTTHLYVKCSPKNGAEYDILTSDSSVEWYDCPMDYEKKIVGNWYQEPGIPDSLPTPQYAAVPVDYKFNSTIVHEILAELYLPVQDKQLRGEALHGNTIYFQQLEQQANLMTRNAPPPTGIYVVPDNPEGGDYSGGYAFPGKIQLFDTRLNRYVPLDGVKVTARVSMFTTYSGMTDWNGDYTLDGYVIDKADYAIKFQRAGFSIKRNRVQNAYISRVNQHGSHWNYGIADGRDRMHGHMFRGAFRYYYGDISDLPRPGNPTVSVGLFSFGVNQGIVSSDGHKAACFDAQGVNLVVAPTLFVARYQNNDNTIEYGSDEIFSTTVHEIAHTSHFNTMHRNIGNFAQVNGTIRESFAVGVEWLLTGMEYKSMGVVNYGDWDYNPQPNPGYPNRQAYQYWGLPDQKNPDYTSLFINLMDDFNESENLLQFWGHGTINDRVSGFRLGDIQLQVLPHAYTMANLQSWLSTLGTNNPTVSQIPLLISQY